MPYPFDATIKDLLAPEPQDFVPVFGLPATQPSVRLDGDLSTISAATDVAIGFGDPLQEIVDLNFQSGPDAGVDARCLLYSAALHHRFRVPVRSVTILLRPKADVKEIQGKLAYESGASGVEFRYEIMRMWKQPVEPFLHGGVTLLPLATLCQLPTDRPVAEAMREIVREIDRRLIAECEHARAARLMTAAFVLAGLRIEREELDSIFDGVRVMHESSAFEIIEEEGAIKAMQKGVLRQGPKRLGAPDESVVKALKAIKDLDRLYRLLDATLIAASWQELLATP